MIKPLHTAGHQLGVKFIGFGEKGRQLRHAVKKKGEEGDVGDIPL